MSLRAEIEYDGPHFPKIIFEYSSDSIMCSTEYNSGNVEANDWRRFVNNLGLIEPDDLEFTTDNGGSSISFDGTRVFFCTSNHSNSIGYTAFSLPREQCLETFQHLADTLITWDANTYL
jgi:hypothetical protein